MTLMTLQQLQSQFSIPKEHLYGFLKICHFEFSNCLAPFDPDMYSDVERFFSTKKDITHLISTFHAQLYSNTTGYITRITQKHRGYWMTGRKP